MGGYLFINLQKIIIIIMYIAGSCLKELRALAALKEKKERDKYIF